ncbi:hypothetical protein HaLaN_31093 [Haematococcus lacustris]|uniref:Uncharacterized protein n=1 Tax=Haematococcus lacustris TaxID=44745 RepID=A0A6A0AH76_HAELA|nr:hypothetical protein HaLaN_31093 [Haematococcus lacustris]
MSWHTTCTDINNLHARKQFRLKDPYNSIVHVIGWMRLVRRGMQIHRLTPQVVGDRLWGRKSIVSSASAHVRGSPNWVGGRAAESTIVISSTGNKYHAKAASGPLIRGGVLSVPVSTSHTHGTAAYQLHYCLTPVTGL